jgi:hypothetical protein
MLSATASSSILVAVVTTRVTSERVEILFRKLEEKTLQLNGITHCDPIRPRRRGMIFVCVKYSGKYSGKLDHDDNA